MTIDLKYEKLKDIIQGLGSAAVAFSGGADSTFLLKVAHDILGDKTLAVTARSATYPERELNSAKSFTQRHGIKHRIIISEELDIEGFTDNPLNRCYLCKSELFTKIKDMAITEELRYVLEGSNYDDIKDFRPGLKAVEEQGIRSPLKEAGLTKQEVRDLSKQLNLPTWNKPSFACLSSRFPYGEKITEDKLKMVNSAEEYLFALGFGQVRVRIHDKMARIEVNNTEMDKLFGTDLSEKINDYLKKIGFTYVTLDLGGYRTGSMNEDINIER